MSPLSFSQNVHKSCENVSFCFCTDQKEVPKNVNQEVDQELGVGKLSLSACPEVGNRPPRKKRIANPAPGVCPRGA